MDKIGLKVVLEVFFMTMTGTACFRYAVRRLDITACGGDPDERVRHLIMDIGDEGVAVKRDLCFIHSTSWRYEHGQTIVLTYLAYSDRMTFSEGIATVFSLTDAPLATSADPGRPRPTEIREEQVAAHAIRHLSFLIKNLQSAVYDILEPDTLRFLQTVNDLPAGKFVDMPTPGGTPRTAAQALHPTKAMNSTSEEDTFGMNPQ